MKVLGYILTFYLILLAVIPCCAFDDCPDDKSVTEQTGSHQNGDEDCGNCSPFFNCEGCAMASINTSIVSFALTPVVVVKKYTEFLLPFIPDAHYDFWQPPKLS